MEIEVITEDAPIAIERYCLPARFMENVQYAGVEGEDVACGFQEVGEGVQAVDVLLQELGGVGRSSRVLREEHLNALSEVCDER